MSFRLHLKMNIFKLFVAFVILFKSFHLTRSQITCKPIIDYSAKRVCAIFDTANCGQVKRFPVDCPGKNLYFS